MLFGHQGQLYVTKSQKGTYIVGLVCSDRILLAKGGLIVTNSNNYSFGNHFFKVLVQIHYSQYRQLSCSNIAHQLMLNFTITHQSTSIMHFIFRQPYLKKPYIALALLTKRRAFISEDTIIANSHLTQLHLSNLYRNLHYMLAFHQNLTFH